MSSVPQHPFIPRRRSGFSLIEMLVVMAVSSVVIGMMITMLRLMLDTERSIGNSSQYALTVSRVSQTFRNDVHNAHTSARNDQEPADALELQFIDNSTVSYTANDHVLTRIKTDSNQTAHRDDFRFPKGSKIQYTIDEDAHRITLTVSRPAGLSGRRTPVAESLELPTRDLVIEAVVGRNQAVLQVGGNPSPEEPRQ